MTPETQAALLALLDHYGPLIGVAFVALCAIAGARSKRDQ